MALLTDFWQNELGQDLVGYRLPMAFIAPASAALFLGAGQNGNRIEPVIIN